MTKKVAVILCGSGYKDGSEIRESVFTLLALNQLNAHVECFAPDDWQKDVVNCLNGKNMEEKRNMLVEAARIARGKIKDIKELKAKNFDALMIPGGFGAAKNLCTFAFEGSAGSVRSDVSGVIRSFYQEKLPIGAVCIAPVIVAMTLKNENLLLTLGDEGEAAQEIVKLGHRHQQCLSSDCVVDKEHRVVTSPAYMDDGASMAEIFQGISKAVREVLSF
jgi:enhancing lycopene biosynthesis protein 2